MWGDRASNNYKKNFVSEGEELGFEFRNIRKPMQAGEKIAEQLERTRQTGPTGSLRDSSLVGMVDNQQENKQ